MAITPIDVGEAPNDGTGDSFRAAFVKVNANEADLQSQINNKVNTSALGTAAAQNVEAFASSTQGGLADTALQPAAIGTTVQAYDADLTTLGGLAKTDGGFIVGTGSTWALESGSTARTSLGLGSAATQATSAFATSTQGSKADTAVQPGDLATVATTGSYDDLTDKPSGGGISSLLDVPGAQVRLVCRNARWEYPSDDSAAVTLTGRKCSIMWEGTEAQIPSQGTGDADFRVGDTALVRAEAL